MFARMTFIEGAPERIDETLGAIREQGARTVRQMEGNKGVITLVERRSGKDIINVTLWESEDALRAAEQPADEVRRSAMKLLGATSPPTVEEYDVVVWEM